MQLINSWLFWRNDGRHKSNEPHLKDVQVFIGIGDAPNKGNGGRFINYLVKILKALGYKEIFQVIEVILHNTALSVEVELSW